MYWLGIAKRITNEQRILAQRSSLSQPHPRKGPSTRAAARRGRETDSLAIVGL
jgi:hypothetical protein